MAKKPKCATPETDAIERYLPDEPPLYEDCDQDSYTEYLDALSQREPGKDDASGEHGDATAGPGDAAGPDDAVDAVVEIAAEAEAETDLPAPEAAAHPEGDEEDADGDEESSEETEHHNRLIARRGEEAAARYLEMCGYTILERNWKCPFGEADIICESEDNDILIFVEVKTRTNLAKGMPEESVTPKKRSRYEKIAACYIRDYEKCDMRVRFDIFSILVSGESRALLRHYINAFGRD